MRFACLLSLCLAAACGTASRPFSDGGGPPPADAKVIDAAPPDAQHATPARETVTSSGHMAGTTYQMDIEVGTAYGQAPMQGGTHKLEGNAAVKP